METTLLTVLRALPSFWEQHLRSLGSEGRDAALRLRACRREARELHDAACTSLALPRLPARQPQDQVRALQGVVARGCRPLALSLDCDAIAASGLCALLSTCAPCASSISLQLTKPLSAEVIEALDAAAVNLRRLALRVTSCAADSEGPPQLGPLLAPLAARLRSLHLSLGDAALFPHDSLAQSCVGLESLELEVDNAHSRWHLSETDTDSDEDALPTNSSSAPIISTVASLRSLRSLDLGGEAFFPHLASGQSLRHSFEALTALTALTATTRLALRFTDRGETPRVWHLRPFTAALGGSLLELDLGRRELDGEDLAVLPLAPHLTSLRVGTVECAAVDSAAAAQRLAGLLPRRLVHLEVSSLPPVPILAALAQLPSLATFAWASSPNGTIRLALFGSRPAQRDQGNAANPAPAPRAPCGSDPWVAPAVRAACGLLARHGHKEHTSCNTLSLQPYIVASSAVPPVAGPHALWVAALARLQLGQLMTLRLQGLQLAPGDLDSLMEAVPPLVVLHVANCGAIQDELWGLARMRPRLQVVYDREESSGEYDDDERYNEDEGHDSDWWGVEGDQSSDEGY